MGNWQDNITEFIPIIVIMGTLNMLRDFLAVEIEERIGRKLTDWEWQYFLQERNRKAEVDSRQAAISQWRQQLADRQTIHDFVWTGGST